MSARKLDKKILWGFGIIVILIIFLTALAVFKLAFWTTNNQVQQRQEESQNKLILDLNGFKTPGYNKDHYISGEVEFSQRPSVVYKAVDFDEILFSLRNVANKLGLNRELKNQKQNEYRWVKVSFRDEEYILMSIVEGTVKISYPNGLNPTSLQTQDYLPFLKEFLGLMHLEIELQSSHQEANFVIVDYFLKYKNKIVYFSSDTPTFMSVIAIDGKIVEVFFYLVSTVSVTEFAVLSPLTKINGENIEKLHYRIHLKLDESYVIDAGMSRVLAPIYPVEIGLRQLVDDGYYFFRNSKGELLYLPILIVKSTLKDAAQARGEAYLLVLNQEP